MFARKRRWDWDTLWTARGLFRFATVSNDPALHQRVGEHAIGSLMNFLNHQSDEGRIPLMIASSFLSALSYSLVALPLPLPVLYAAVAVAGFSLSIAMTASIAGVLAIATGGAIGTANSLRTMVNRVAQFIIPILASAIAMAVGTGSVFVILGVGLAASGAAVHFDTKRSESD